MKVLEDCKKAIEIFEGKQDLKKQVIKPNWNVFNILF